MEFVVFDLSSLIFEVKKKQSYQRRMLGVVKNEENYLLMFVRSGIMKTGKLIRLHLKPIKEYETKITMAKDINALQCLYCGESYYLDNYDRKKSATCRNCGSEMIPLVAERVHGKDSRGFCVLMGFLVIAALMGALGCSMLVHGWNFWVTFTMVGGIIFLTGKIFVNKYKITEMDEGPSSETVSESSDTGYTTGFDRLVTDAIHELPKNIKDYLSTVSIIVEDRPNNSLLEKLRLRPNISLLGLFEGVPLNRRSVWQSGTIPERITIFQKNIEAISHSDEEVKQRIKKVMRHEVAHFVGFTEEEIRGMGY